MDVSTVWNEIADLMDQTAQIHGQIATKLREVAAPARNRDPIIRRACEVRLHDRLVVDGVDFGEVVEIVHSVGQPTWDIHTRDEASDQTFTFPGDERVRVVPA